MAGPLDSYRIAMTFEVGDSAHAFGMGGVRIWYSPALPGIVKLDSYGRLGPPL
jgi:hypothetical protein